MKGVDMRKLIIALLVTGLMAGVAMAAPGTEVAKIGVVDVQKVIKETEEGKAIRDEIRKQWDTMRAELKSKDEALKSASDQFERESEVMSDAMKAQKLKDLRASQNELRQLTEKYRGELAKMEKEKIENLLKKLADVTQEIGKKENYLIIREKRGLIYGPESLDITDRVVDILNRNRKAAAP
jgi:outer membrane protein